MFNVSNLPYLVVYLQCATCAISRLQWLLYIVDCVRYLCFQCATYSVCISCLYWVSPVCLLCHVSVFTKCYLHCIYYMLLASFRIHFLQSLSIHWPSCQLTTNPHTDINISEEMSAWSWWMHGHVSCFVAGASVHQKCKDPQGSL